MNDLQQRYTQNFGSALDRFNSLADSPGPRSLEDLRRTTPVVAELVLAQWSAGLDTKTKHDLLRSSIDAIK